jgi:hypothetical protein
MLNLLGGLGALDAQRRRRRRGVHDPRPGEMTRCSPRSRARSQSARHSPRRPAGCAARRRHDLGSLGTTPWPRSAPVATVGWRSIAALPGIVMASRHGVGRTGRRARQWSVSWTEQPRSRDDVMPARRRSSQRRVGRSRRRRGRARASGQCRPRG